MCVQLGSVLFDEDGEADVSAGGRRCQLCSTTISE